LCIKWLDIYRMDRYGVLHLFYLEIHELIIHESITNKCIKQYWIIFSYNCKGTLSSMFVVSVFDDISPVLFLVIPIVKSLK